MNTVRLISLCVMLAALSPVAYAQPQKRDEPLLDQFRDHLKSESFSLGIFARLLASFEEDRENGGNGFSIGAARVSARGRLDRSLSYMVQTELISDRVLLDARLSYHLNQQFRIDAGLFKSPFSAEFLISSSRTDFLRRSRAVRALAPNRQIGIALHGNTSDNFLNIDLGLFNGNGRVYGGNDDDAFLYTGRATMHPASGIDIGVNAVYNDREAGGWSASWGGDVRIELARLLLTGEALFGRSTLAEGTDLEASGYQATIGYTIAPGHQVLVRQESFFSDAEPVDRHFLVVGYSYFISSAFKMQINYFAPLDTDSGHQEILAGLQIAI